MLTLDSIMKVAKLEAAYGDRGRSMGHRIIKIASLQKSGGKTVQISTFIGQDPVTGEWRMMTK